MAPVAREQRQASSAGYAVARLVFLVAPVVEQLAQPRTEWVTLDERRARHHAMTNAVTPTPSAISARSAIHSESWNKTSP